MNTNIYSYLETSGGQYSIIYLNVVHDFNTSVHQTPVVAEDSCFPAIVSNMRCAIGNISTNTKARDKMVGLTETENFFT